MLDPLAEMVGRDLDEVVTAHRQGGIREVEPQCARLDRLELVELIARDWCGGGIGDLAPRVAVGRDADPVAVGATAAILQQDLDGVDRGRGGEGYDRRGIEPCPCVAVARPVVSDLAVDHAVGSIAAA